MMSLKEYSDPNQASLADYIPWAMLVAPGVVEHKDGALQKTFRFRGPDLDSATKYQLMSISALFNNAIKRLGDGWTLFVEAQRNPVADYPTSLWPNQASKMIDDERRQMFVARNNNFENDYFLTCIFKTPSLSAFRLKAYFLDKVSDSRSDNLNSFIEAIKGSLTLLDTVFPTLAELSDEETLTYLHSTVSTKRHKIVTPDVPMYLDHILTDESVEHGLSLKLGEYFVRTLSIKAFPSESFPGILDSISDLSFSFRWSNRFICMSQELAKNHIEKVRRVWYAGRKRISTVLKEVASQSESALGETSSLRKSEDADEAMQLLDDGLVSFGFFTATVSVWALDQKTADKRLSENSLFVN